MRCLSDQAMETTSVDQLIAGLQDFDGGCGFKSWPGNLKGLNLPGLYAWWADADAAAIISARLGGPVCTGIVYVGQAGALNGRANSDATLSSRLGGNHIAGKVRNSTVRLTAAAILLEEVRNYIEGDRSVGKLGEQLISDWLAAHFRVTIVPVDNREWLAQIEAQVLAKLDPPLNLRGMQLTRARAELEVRRRALRGQATPHEKSVSTPQILANASRVSDTITLHDEIVAILSEFGNPWLSTSQIARVVNERGLYAKRDGSPVTDFQIHGRTRNYSHLFERRGSQVRILPE